MSKFKNSIYQLLKGDFLVNEDSFKNWRFMLFMVMLMMVMIASSHSSDKKVMEIAKLNKKVKQLRSEFVDTRSTSMNLKLESTIKIKVLELELKPSETPPQVIRVTHKK
ncbi:MAG: S-adenosyl-methyltransferase [Lutibacter sp.]|uniref:FtsL-like putative cell division protein n=1 Tax=Lutibacter sp. TaxID=1925666 RepID=UPI0019ED33BD|nr:FtsL-like putative cell division protein [Lutibacter sp.]NOR28675.1 S-adenosyl-methyltransferase [Lutibacter sp.]